MRIKNFNKILLSSGLIFFYGTIFGQSKSNHKPLIIVSDINKSKYCYGDTIFFTIKNKAKIIRGYTIEIISINNNSESKDAFNSELYTAYFNNDSSFFKNLKKSRQVSNNNNIGYLSPNAKVLPRIIAVDSTSTYHFIVKGNKSKDGVKMKFKIIPDIIDEEPDYEIETKSFWLFINPL